MRKTALGRTGLEISELAFGGGVTAGILINPNEVTRYSALRRAVASGINWIDTAPAYGNGASEETIGRHLKSLSPQPHVSTKVRLETEDLGDIPGAIERSLEQSLERLRSDSLALLQLHNHLGRGVGDRLALTPAQVLDRAWRRRHLRPAQGAGPHPSLRHHCGRRYASLSRRHQQRALRHCPGLLQCHQSERGLAACAGRLARGPELLRHPGGVLQSKHGRLEHPGLGGRGTGQSGAARRTCS